MNITTPQDTEDQQLLEDIVSQFEEVFKNKQTNESFYLLVINGEYPRELLDKVQELYLKVGWTKVVCKTSTENNERPGLTGLKLWNKIKKPNKI